MLHGVRYHAPIKLSFFSCFSCLFSCLSGVKKILYCNIKNSYYFPVCLLNRSFVTFQNIFLFNRIFKIISIGLNQIITYLANSMVFIIQNNNEGALIGNSFHRTNLTVNQNGNINLKCLEY
jgi:hypothetical protein